VGRINAMMDIWGLQGAMSAEAEVAAEASQGVPLGTASIRALSTS
jgi:hypothetical protein